MRGAWIGVKPRPSQAVHWAVPGGVPAERLHVTLGYFNRPADDLDPAIRERVRGQLREFAEVTTWPVSARATGWQRWGENGVLLLKGEGLDALAGTISSALPGLLDETYPWEPHLTVQKPGDPLDFVPIPTGPLLFEHLALWWGPTVHTCTPKPGKKKVRS